MPSKKKSSKSVNWSSKKLNWQVVLVVLLFAVGGTWLLARSFAASPSSSTGSSIKLDQTDPYLGSNITFTSVYPKLKSNITPRIEVLCFQDVNGDGMVNSSDNNPVTNPDFVYGEAGSADQSYQQSLTGNPGFLLGGGGSIWKTRGGAATCKANLFYYAAGKGTSPQTYNFLATTGIWPAGAAR